MVLGTLSHDYGRWESRPSESESYHVHTPVPVSNETRAAAGSAAVPYETSERNAL